ncbi:DUF4003 family protein [Halobacillus litoralis]|uniref:DUF4003 domain-containing protein n=1 Tax=Halobacillus litoralis TaxID=45668 RepID=A0A410M9R8_9BACI|nr:DUF4003 family protein [Halobacillus litoralis]QAS51423.1 hypothetical protein HLI_03905 [Halobacillus litoralis]
MPLSKELAQLKETYTDVYEQLRKEMRWTDKKIVMMVASVYVTSDRKLDIHRYLKLCETIKKDAGMFSYLKSPLRYSVAAMLDSSFEDPFEAFNEMMKVYKSMIHYGFNRSQYTYLAAVAMIQNDPRESEYKEKVQRAVEIHQLMKKEHPFLTSHDDYPLAVLLSQREVDTETLIVQVEHIYRSLDRNGFRKGNHLQFLSHMLSLDEAHTADELIDRTVNAANAIKSSDIRFKSMLYPEAGLLAFLGDEENKVYDIKDFKKALDQEGPFKWQNDMNVKIAVNILVSHQLQEANNLQTGLFTTLETIMQAQQVATLAGVTGATAAASAGDGGGGGQ